MPTFILALALPPSPPTPTRIRAPPPTPAPALRRVPRQVSVLWPSLRPGADPVRLSLDRLAALAQRPGGLPLPAALAEARRHLQTYENAWYAHSFDYGGSSGSSSCCDGTDAASADFLGHCPASCAFFSA